jgi:hypothetical protein
MLAVQAFMLYMSGGSGGGVQVFSMGIVAIIFAFSIQESVCYKRGCVEWFVSLHYGVLGSEPRSERNELERPSSRARVDLFLFSSSLLAIDNKNDLQARDARRPTRPNHSPSPSHRFSFTFPFLKKYLSTCAPG